MFEAGDKVKIDLKKLWDFTKPVSMGDMSPINHITSEGHRIRNYNLYHANGSLAARNGYSLQVIRVDTGSVFLDYGIVLSWEEANVCLEMVQEKEKSFKELFEELSDTVTLDEVERFGTVLYSKAKRNDQNSIYVQIYEYENKNYLVAYRDGENITFREYTGEIPKEVEVDPPRKRVVQISVDVEIDAAENGDVVAEQIAEELEGCGRVVLGSAFQEDMSLEYDYEVEI